ncbi:S-methyl-5-thioribose kinase [Bacillus sp. FJAT-47783]|uniref:S-methyl-5-thioribose kinase n=1 Tax=Bacillus sp. FJAT-47783 TaxID=2922712 RepID=UPI001FAB7F5B|nr:S-methyl-5-thioribose kinase [Bacillus sp. FJAT-47783]
MTTNYSTYEPLTTETACDLVQRLGIIERTEGVECTEVGDGNVNLVFRVVNHKINHSVIVKQALPYAKVVGESGPLPLKRASIEAHALIRFKGVANEFVPTVYYFDEKLAVTVMEDLSHLDRVRTGLVEGKEYPLLSKHIGEYLGNTLFHTSDFALHAVKKKRLLNQFCNPELCNITKNLVFTDPFFNYETNDFKAELLDDVNAIRKDESLLLEVAQLKKKFLTNQDALIHGDLHTGNIFANERETKVIDPEFAFFGPIGFDIGLFFANLLLNYISRSEAGKESLLNHLASTWDTFVKTYSARWKEHHVETCSFDHLHIVIASAFEDAIGFSGCEIIRRTIGLAQVADLDTIEPYELRITKKKKALQLGSTLINKRRYIHTIDELINSVQNIAREKEKAV